MFAASVLICECTPGTPMTGEELEQYETGMELALYHEYRDVVELFKYVVETDRRFYLCNQVDVKVRSETGDAYFEVSMNDAWVWDIYRKARFAKSVKVLTFKDVNVEELDVKETARDAVCTLGHARVQQERSLP